MSKSELINAVAEAAKMSKRAAAINVTFQSLAKATKKEKRFQVAGFFSESRRVERWNSSAAPKLKGGPLERVSKASQSLCFMAIARDVGLGPTADSPVQHVRGGALVSGKALPSDAVITNSTDLRLVHDLRTMINSI